MIAEKLGVEDLFTLYEVQGFSQRRLLDNEKPLDITASWKAVKKEHMSKFLVKQQPNKVKGAVMTTVDRTKTPIEKPLPPALPMVCSVIFYVLTFVQRVVRFYSATPEYTYWTIGLNAFLTVKDVKDTIARKLEINSALIALSLEVEGEKNKTLSDSDNIIDMETLLTKKKAKYKFIVHVPSQKGKRPSCINVTNLPPKSKG